MHVRIEPHGRDITVQPGQSVLDAALSAGLNLPHSCKSGHCGSCRARLLRGRIEYPRGRPLGLSDSEAAAGQVLLCQVRACSDLVVEVRLVARVGEVEIKTLPCRIERMERPAPDVMRVWLRLPAVESFSYQAGQYLDVLLDDDQRRSFSIASPPHDSQFLELHVRHAPGGAFTTPLFARTGIGALLRIEGPLGQFAYLPSNAPLLLVAGGTGFAPIKAILRHILETHIERDVHLYWGARTANDLYEDAAVLALTAQDARLRYVAVLSQAAAPAAAHQRLGWVHEAVLADHAELSAHDIYVAGPPALVEAARVAFAAAGALPQRIYFDSFDYAPRAPEKPP